ncbi:MAG: sugar ABC transporter permease [Actinomycetota bacterium]|nr:sugar ABC transporter permease [Actinomycetota bacterium]
MAESATGPGTGTRPSGGLVLGALRTLKNEVTDKERRLAYILVTPAVVIILAIALVPLLYAIWLSFQEIIINQSSSFVGLQNYVEMLQDSDFHSALINTTVFTVLSVSLELVAGMAIALALSRAFKGRGIARATALAPWALPPAIAAVMWRLMFQDEVGGGIVAYLIKSSGIYSHPILGSDSALIVAAVLVDAWKTTPFMALLLLAGLQVIPQDVYEASKVDGATSWQQFWRVTLPLVRPAMLVALLFRTLDAWRVYDLLWVMGNRQLNSLSVYVYNGVKISQLDFSLGNAAAVFVFLSSIAIALVFIKVLGTRAVD